MTDTTAVPDPFEGLDFGAVDWGALTHAYGSAEDIPAWIRSLTSADDEVRSEALDALIGSICHQGTVYEASAPAVPFLARAAVVAPAGRTHILFLLAGMARQYGEDWSDPSTFTGAVRVQIASVLGELAPLLTDPESWVRRAMLRVLAVCPPQAVREMCDLREFDDADGYVRADALLALARTEHDWPGLRPRLEESLKDGSPAVRQAAAFTLLSLDGLPFSRDIMTILADSIGAVGDLCAEPGDESWDRLPGTLIPDPDSPDVAAGRDAPGILATLRLDPDAALEAAARIAAARTGHAVQGAYLADEVYEQWRDRDRPVAAVLAEFLSATADIKYPAAHLHRLARCACRIDDPDPSIAAAVRPWAGHDNAQVASAAIGVLARVRDPGCIELARSAIAQRRLHETDLDAVCEVYGEDAALLLPGLRDQLTEHSESPQPSTGRDPAAGLVQALPRLGTEALASVPDLLGLLESGRAVKAVLGVLTRFGAAALKASGSRDIATIIRAVFTDAATDYDRVPAAVALRTVSGDDSLGRQLAAEIAARPQWDSHTVPLLGRLGPAAAGCASRIAQGLDSGDQWTAVRAAEAYWRITGETGRCADVLARHVSARPVGTAAVAALLEMRQVPRQCVRTLAHLVYTPQRLVWDGTPGGAMHADDVTRDNARALLRLRKG